MYSSKYLTILPVQSNFNNGTNDLMNTRQISNDNVYHCNKAIKSIVHSNSKNFKNLSLMDLDQTNDYLVQNIKAKQIKSDIGICAAYESNLLHQNNV